MSDRDSTGRFSKGNKVAKKDMTKEMAKDMVSKELWWIAKIIANTPQSEVKEMVKDGKFEDESVMMNSILKNIVQKNNVKTLIWFAEMLVGKPKQQSETIIKSDNIALLKYNLGENGDSDTN